jgi:phosphatidylserine synthase
MDKMYGITYNRQHEQSDISSDAEDIDRKIYNDTILSGKIHESLEDPVSQTMYDLSEVISPTLYNAGVTPNIVTTTRLIMTLVGFVYFFQNGYYRTASILFFASYFGDCLDGHMARKYNLETVFGDYYDHLADALFLILSVYFMAVNIHPEYDWLVIVLIILAILSFVQIGCEERYLKLMGVGKDSDTLSGMPGLCPESVICDEDLDDLMEFSRLIGVGVYILIMAIIIWNFKYFENDTI